MVRASCLAWSAIAARELGHDLSFSSRELTLVYETPDDPPAPGPGLERLEVSILDQTGREVLRYECVVPKPR
jgi:hypothetical protein